MATINGNILAIAITLQEGKKVSVPIGQVKEIIRLVQKMLSKFSEEEVLAWIKKSQ